MTSYDTSHTCRPEPIQDGALWRRTLRIPMRDGIHLATGEVPACFGEQMPVRERAAYHVDHGDDVGAHCAESRLAPPRPQFGQRLRASLERAVRSAAIGTRS